MDWPVIIMVAAFVILLMMNVPIAISIGLATLRIAPELGVASLLLISSTPGIVVGHAKGGWWGCVLGAVVGSVLGYLVVLFLLATALQPA